MDYLRTWLDDAAVRFPSVARSWGITRISEALIDAARKEVGAPPFARVDGRTRRALVNHADLSTCSRDRKPGESLDPATHRLRHKRIHVHQCHGCYIRHYIYVRNHPQMERPKDWWRDGDPRSATLNGRPRAWVDPGWAGQHPDPVQGEFDRIMAALTSTDAPSEPPPLPKPESPKEFAARNYREWAAYRRRGGKPLRLMQGTWPLTDDEDPE